MQEELISYFGSKATPSDISRILNPLRPRWPLAVPVVARAGTLRVAGSAAAIVAYVFSYPAIQSLGGSGAAALSILPVALIAWFYGLRVGIVAGVLAFPLNTALVHVFSGLPWDAVLVQGGGPGTVVIVVIGGVIGQMSAMHERLRRQTTALVTATLESAERARLEGVLLAANTMQHHLCNQLTLTRGYTWLLANSDELTDIYAEMALEAERGVVEASEMLDRLVRLTSVVEVQSDATLPPILDLEARSGLDQ